MATQVRTNQQANQHVRSSGEDPKSLMQDCTTYLRDYAKENPEIAAIWCFGIGFILGWKMKIW